MLIITNLLKNNNAILTITFKIYFPFPFPFPIFDNFLKFITLS
jgi:hypothetical protein